MVDALRVSPKTKKGRPAKMTDRSTVNVGDGMDTAAYCLTSNDISPPFHWL